MTGRRTTIAMGAVLGLASLVLAWRRNGTPPVVEAPNVETPQVEAPLPETVTGLAEALTGDAATVQESDTIEDPRNWSAWQLIPMQMRAGMGPRQRELVDGINQLAEQMRKDAADATSSLDRRAREAETRSKQRILVERVTEDIRNYGLDHWAFRVAGSSLDFGEIYAGTWTHDDDAKTKTETLVRISITDDLLTSAAGATIRRLEDGDTVYVVCRDTAIKKYAGPEIVLEGERRGDGSLYEVRSKDPGWHGRFELGHWQIEIDGDHCLVLTERDFDAIERLRRSETEARLAVFRQRLEQAREFTNLARLRDGELPDHPYGHRPIDLFYRWEFVGKYASQESVDLPTAMQRVNPDWTLRDLTRDPWISWLLAHEWTRKDERDRRERRLRGLTYDSGDWGQRFPEADGLRKQARSLLPSLIEYDIVNDRYLVNPKALVTAREYLAEAKAEVAAGSPSKDTTSRAEYWGWVVEFIDDAVKSDTCVFVDDPPVDE